MTPSIIFVLTTALAGAEPSSTTVLVEALAERDPQVRWLAAELLDFVNAASSLAMSDFETPILSAMTWKLLPEALSRCTRAR